MMKFGIIGLGRMGFVQARLGRFFGHEILWGIDRCAAAGEEFQREFNTPVYSDIEIVDFANVDVVWMTVNDDQIESCAQRISPRLSAGTTVFHTSGVMDSAILKKHLPSQSCASYHPLQACPLKTCSDEECAQSYSDIIHTVEGDVSAVNIAKSLIARFGGRFVQINSADKALYHAAAVFSSNYPLTLMDIAVRLFERCGFDEDNAMLACKRMMAQIVKSVDNHSIQDALTGPVKRKDLSTIERHQNALQEFPEYLKLYNLLKDATEKMLQ